MAMPSTSRSRRLAEKDEKDRTDAETLQLQQVQNSRALPLNVSIEYSGAIHQLIVTFEV